MARPKQFDPDDRLDRAVDAFWQHGFDGSAMPALCEAMGLFPGSLYRTYGDKRQLFLQAIERYMATVSADAFQALDGGGPDEIRCFFARLIDAMVDGKRRWGCLVTNSIVELAPHEPAIAALTDQHLKRLEAAFAAALAPAGDATDRAALLVCTVQGLNVLAKTRPPRARLERIVEAALAGLDAPHPPTRSDAR